MLHPPATDGRRPAGDRGPRGESGRLGWGFADQLLSSLSNFALALLVAGVVDRVDFGAFSLAFATYALLLGTARAAGAEPLAVRHAADAGDRWREAAGAAVGTAVAIGAAGTALVLAAGLLAGPRLSQTLVPLALALPFLLAQDAWRGALVAAGRADRAFANDLVWVVTQFGLLAVLLVRGDPPVAGLVAAWGVGAAVAAVVGCLQAGVRPRPGAWRRWLGAHRDLWPRFTLEFWAMSGTWQLGLYVLAAVAGLAATGAVRGAQTVLGPATLVILAVPVVVVPELVRRAQAGGPASVAAASARLAVALGALPLVVGALLLTLPAGVGTRILGETWSPARAVLPAMAVFVASTGVNVAAVVGLRALAAARASLRARLVASPMVLAGIVTGAVAGGAGGAAVGLAVANWSTTLVWWRALRRVVAAEGGRA